MSVFEFAMEVIWVIFREASILGMSVWLVIVSSHRWMLHRTDNYYIFVILALLLLIGLEVFGLPGMFLRLASMKKRTQDE